MMTRTRKIEWAGTAKSDLKDIVAYIKKNNRQAARELTLYVNDIVAEMATATRPIGRPGEAPGTFERVLTRYKSYLLIFKFDDSTLYIIRLFHTAQDAEKKVTAL